MKHVSTTGKRKLFHILTRTPSCQAAMMTLRPGSSSSDEVENEHPRAEQWLYVISGSGTATIGKRNVALKSGSLLIIEKREPHKITASGRSDLVTINFYLPPAYDGNGEVLSSVKGM